MNEKVDLKKSAHLISENVTRKRVKPMRLTPACSSSMLNNMSLANLAKRIFFNI